MEDKVDILLTTYNTKIEYLKKQIDSILDQTHKNFNLIISDDCSPNEEVRKVLKDYEQKDNRIILYFQEKNLGYTKNFEFVLTKSNSEFIAFSDHDDIWYENKIEESLKELKKKQVDLVYCDAKQIDKNDNILNESYLRYKNMPIISGKDILLPFSRHIAIGCSQLFTKRVKEKMLPFTENTIAHDWNSLYIANRLNGFTCIDKPLLGYRLHDDNAFGGRSFKQNITKWKQENGTGYKSYLKYRKYVISETYMAGSLMCQEYDKRIVKNNKYLEDRQNNVIQYYKKAQKSKIIFLSIHKYFKYLYFKNIGKRTIKEIMILHFPILSYLVFSKV